MFLISTACPLPGYGTIKCQLKGPTPAQGKWVLGHAHGRKGMQEQVQKATATILAAVGDQPLSLLPKEQLSAFCW